MGTGTLCTGPARTTPDRIRPAHRRGARRHRGTRTSCRGHGTCPGGPARHPGGDDGLRCPSHPAAEPFVPAVDQPSIPATPLRTRVRDAVERAWADAVATE